MISIPGYQINKKLYESKNSAIYRAQRDTDNTRVILKILNDEYPTPEQIASFKQEYEIICTFDFEGVIKAYALENYKNSLFMVLEDFAGEPIANLLKSRKLKLGDFLHLAIQITGILGKIHQKNIIHKDINPSNIILNTSTNQVKIIDFGISTVLSHENPLVFNPDLLEGTLPYISPEQTGRMNRSIDYHTDFYSLGVTFYEILLGFLPFQSTDNMELVHSHLAKKPVSPYESNKNIPKVVSDIVMKLMEKTAENRYQSAFGITADLQECLNQMNTAKKIEYFAVGQQDISDKFQIPQKLYGRKIEIETLLSAFKRITHGTTEMMVIAGYSGIGKTSVVREIYKPLAMKHGYFIVGKFDQFNRNIPYVPLIHAFQSLIHQILTESTEQITRWKEKLLNALGPNGQIIIDMIPQVELIIGKQPPVSELTPEKTQNRINIVFQNFVRTFATEEHPFAIFLDDLQWADESSLKLIEYFMTDSETKHFFIIGSYRDNEVNSTHPLILTLEEIKKSEAVINTIVLKPLNLASSNQMIADTLQCDLQECRQLSELCLEKTNGNPFFLNQFLQSLYDENLITFNGKRGKWQWNINKIKKLEMTDNVVELMASKIQKLPRNTQNALKLAACIGNRFDLKTLGIVSEGTETKTKDDLWQAIMEELIFIVGVNGTLTYKFLHDRVQQAAYMLIEENYKKEINLKIGRLLLKSISQNDFTEKIFDIVNHLNIGRQLIKDQIEKNKLVELNLMAGRKAKIAAAYKPAFNYLQVAIELLNKNSWQQLYDLTLSVHIEAAEAAYLTTDFEQMEKLAKEVLNRAKTLLDKVRAYEVKIQAYTAQKDFLESVKTALKVLKLLGISLPKKPGKLTILLGLVRTTSFLAGKKTEDLIHLPEMTDANKLAAIRILSIVITPTYFVVPDLFPLMVFKMINLSIRYGNTSVSAFAYATYGLILCGVLGRIESGYKFGKLALNLSGLSNTKEFQTRTYLVVSSLINHWKEHAKDMDTPLLKTYQSGLETGDLEYAALSLYIYSANSYFTGKELVELEQEMTKYINAIGQLKQEKFLYSTKLYHQIVLNLTGHTENPQRLIGESYDEEKMLPFLKEANDETEFFNLYYSKLILSYLFNDYSQAFKNAEMVKEYLDAVQGALTVPISHFYDSLTRLAIFHDVSKSEQKLIFKKVAANQKKMKKWADHAPMNHLHKYYLVEAERMRVLGQNMKAMDFYDRAIELAKKHEYINEEALTNEVTARFYFSIGKEKIAQTYITEARYYYLKWGASTKVEHLDKKYPGLLTQKTMTSEVEKTRPTKHISTHITSIPDTGLSLLDLDTVVKASQTILGEIKLAELLRKVMKFVVENAGAQKGFLILESHDNWFIQAESAVDSEDVEVLQSIPIENSESVSTSIIHYVSRTKENVVLNDAIQEGNFTRDPYIIKNQLKSVLCTPLINQGKLRGILYLENNLTTGAFTKNRLKILNLLSSQMAISIENAKLYTSLEEKVKERTQKLMEREQAERRLIEAENQRKTLELERARKIQQQFLPSSMPEVSYLDIAAFQKTATEVGGDYYDFFLQTDDKIYFVLGDATGHGVGSGLVVAATKTALHMIDEDELSKMISVLNSALKQANLGKRENMALLLVKASLNKESNSVHIQASGGGITPMYIIRSTGEVEEKITTGLPLGIILDFKYESLEFYLQKSDVLILASDGLVERMNDKQKILGYDYLIEKLNDIGKIYAESNNNTPVSEILEDIIEIGDEWSNNTPQDDDVTALVIKIK